MKKTIKTIFWDLDGTLIDSEHIHNSTGFAALEKLNIAYHSNEIPSGMENKTAFAYLTGLDLTQEKNLQLFKEWDDLIVRLVIEQITGADAINSSIELVKHFHELGIKQSVVSNSYYNLVEHSLQELGILQLVDSIFARDMVEFGKPHPQLYLDAISHHQQLPEQCLTFEDSNTGITAAKAANINVVGIGLHTRAYQPETSLDISSSQWLQKLEKYYTFI